jgi:hypothetical protein
MLSNLKSLIIFLFIRRFLNMVDMYLALVIAGRRTCNPENKSVPLVPTRYRKAVTTELEALGLDADGNPVTTVA